jgi:ankyrin repeat protein
MHYLAAENHNINVIRLAYDKVKNNLIDNQGRTPFDHAIISRNINAISVLESQAKSTLLLVNIDLINIIFSYF